MEDADLLRRHGHVVRRLAHTLGARCGVDADELWSAGALGLLDAVKRFDVKRGVRLEAFVLHRVRGAILDELRRMDRLPRRLRNKVQAMDRARQQLGNALGREATRDEIASAMNVEPGDIDRFEGARVVFAFEETASDAPMLDDRLCLLDRAREVRAAIEALPPRLQSVLSFRYVEELTLREIAAILGVSEPRVCQLHTAALTRLRRALRS